MERKIRASHAHLAPHRGGCEGGERPAGLALAIRILAWGGRKTAPLEWRRLRSASAHLQAGRNCSDKLAVQLRACSSPELRQLHCPLGGRGLRGAQRARRPARRRQTRLHPEIEGLRSDLSIRQHRQALVTPGDAISPGPIGSPADGRRLCPGTFLHAGGLNGRLRATTERVRRSVPPRTSWGQGYEVKATSTLSLTDSKALNEENITPTVWVTLQKGPSIAVCTSARHSGNLSVQQKMIPCIRLVRCDVVSMCTHLGVFPI
jgi:hypothetical protein